MAESNTGFPGGMPDESNLTPWIERLIGRSLGDVRIHDSTQAGALAGRLGARAFAVGRDVYVRPELLRPLTPRSVSLLAHELTHAAEQTGAAPVTTPSAVGLGLPHAPVGAAPAVQRVEGGGGSQGAEARAVAVEAAALQALQAPSGPRGAAAPDLDVIAEAVYQRMLRDLRIGQERGAHR